MTVSDLLDQVRFDSGDPGSDYRNASRRWLNLTRSYIADRALWRSALDATNTLTTSASNTTGLYSVGDYDFIAGDLYDETNGNSIKNAADASLNEIDPAKETSGSPQWWSDAGADDSGLRQIYLWPVPDGTYTIRVPAYRRLTALDDGDDGLEDDPFFGPIMPWSAAFAAGMRYFHDLNDNTDVGQITLQLQTFRAMIQDRKSKNSLAPNAATRLQVIRTSQVVNQGRFDPAHYRNR